MQTRSLRPLPALPLGLVVLSAIALGTLRAPGTAAAAESGDRDATPTRHVAIRDTGVRLIVPEGFRLAAEFPGLGRDEDLTSVLVTALPFPLPIALESVSPESLLQRGLTPHRQGRVEVDGREATLIHASQQAAGMEFRKWMLVFGDDRSSVLIAATTPLEHEARYQEALVETLRTARWTPPREPAPATLSFSVGEPPPLRIVTSGPDAVVLSDPDRMEEAGAPLVSVGMSRAQVQIGDVAAFARQRLEESVTVDRIEVRDELPRELAEMAGHEIEADARDTATGQEVRVFHLLATDGARYALIQGVVARDEAEAFRALFDAVVASFALRAGEPG